MRKNPVFKIILGIFFPPSIGKLEFKTREELELMPQTEEELQDRDDSKSTSSASSSSSSSSASSRRSSVHGAPGGGGGLGGHFGDSDVENSSRYRGSTRRKISQNGCDEKDEGDAKNIGFDSTAANSFQRMDTTNSLRKKTRPLRLKKKLYEFYAAPITKYYCHSVSSRYIKSE